MTSTVTDAPTDGGVGAWLPYAVLAVMTSILALEYTKQAMLPKTQTPVLWAAEGATIAGTIVLRSGWWRDAGWSAAQADFGAVVNDFYAPRRASIVNSFAVGFGTIGCLWWALATWAVVLRGMRRGVAGRGFLDFEIAALAGALSAGIVGAAVGRIVGHVWETRHRRQRAARRSARD